MQLYVNYYDRYEKLPEENPTIGILAVRLALPENNKTILASTYQLYLPTEEQLVKEINVVKELAKKKKDDDTAN